MQDMSHSHKTRHAPVVSDPKPMANIGRMWTSASKVATVGIFLMLFGAVLYFARAVLMPVLGAAVVATTFAPLIKRAKRFGVPPWVTALFVVLLFSMVVVVAATVMAGPVSEWIAQAPKIEAAIKQAFSALDEPISALRSLENALLGSAPNTVSVAPSPPSVIMPVLAFITPAAAELILFLVVLVFILASQIEIHATFAMMFASRESKLRYLKIVHDIENKVVGYLIVVSTVNAVLGVIVALGTWAFGLPNPAVFGILAAVLNYVPYLGPAAMAFILFGFSLVTFSSVAHAMVAPLCIIALAGLEGHFITPAIVGRRFTINPLLVVLGLAFWTWIWGPIGAFFAVPVSIVFLVIHDHLFAEDGSIPGAAL